MIKALQAIQEIRNNPNNNYLLVGDSDFLYLYLKKIIKESNTDLIETKLFDCSDKSTSQQNILNTLNAIDLFADKNLIVIKNYHLLLENKEYYSSSTCPRPFAYHQKRKECFSYRQKSSHLTNLASRHRLEYNPLQVS